MTPHSRRTNPAFRRTGLIAGAALTLLVLTACAPRESDANPTSAPSPVASSPTAEPSTTPVDEPAPATEPTCETIIPETTVAEFEGIGWTARAEPFLIGGVEVPDGVQCVWANFEGPASDQLQMFGWAPIDEAAAAEALARLQSEGWTTEEGAEGTYVTEPAETAVATDADGYGITYLFAEGSVKVADTKQSLLLVEWG